MARTIRPTIRLLLIPPFLAFLALALSRSFPKPKSAYCSPLTAYLQLPPPTGLKGREKSIQFFSTIGIYFLNVWTAFRR
jgi:hypothetical protein